MTEKNGFSAIEEGLKSLGPAGYISNYQVPIFPCNVKTLSRVMHLNKLSSGKKIKEMRKL